jgi:hypothetical protein
MFVIMLWQDHQEAMVYEMAPDNLRATGSSLGTGCSNVFVHSVHPASIMSMAGALGMPWR